MYSWAIYSWDRIPDCFTYTLLPYTTAGSKGEPKSYFFKISTAGLHLLDGKVNLRNRPNPPCLPHACTFKNPRLPTQ